MRNPWITCCLTGVLALAAACGSSGGSSAGGSTMSSMATNQATAALASKLGIPAPLVDMALSRAQSMFSGGSSKTNAAQAGVEAAAAQAESQGKPLLAEQKSGLLEGLTNLI